MPEGLVNFIYGTQANYDALEEYNADALYFITDTNKLYKGDTLIANYVNERVIAAALVDLNNNLSSTDEKIDTLINSINSRINSLSSDIANITVTDSNQNTSIGKLEKSVKKLNNVESNLNQLTNDFNTLDLVVAHAEVDLNNKTKELDEILAGVGNDINDRLTSLENISNLNNIILDNVDSRLENAEQNLAKWVVIN